MLASVIAVYLFDSPIINLFLGLLAAILLVKVILLVKSSIPFL